MSIYRVLGCFHLLGPDKFMTNKKSKIIQMYRHSKSTNKKTRECYFFSSKNDHQIQIYPETRKIHARLITDLQDSSLCFFFFCALLYFQMRKHLQQRKSRQMRQNSVCLGSWLSLRSFAIVDYQSQILHFKPPYLQVCRQI